jgi:ribosomal-protein-alanine N-acetyltransferase
MSSPLSHIDPAAGRCVLRTPRLIVRVARRGDEDAIAAHYRADEAHLNEFSPATPPMLEPSFWREWIEQTYIEIAVGRSCRTFLYELDDRTVIGSANLTNIIRGVFQACYLGYAIARTHEGKGLMFEALQALLRFAFDDLNLHRIMANYMPRNRRSGALLERLGFVIEGTAKDYLRINDVWEDHVMTSLTNDAWRP